MLWMPEITDPVEHVNQGFLIARLEYNVGVDRGAVTEALPVGQNGIPGVLNTQIIPRWYERRHVSGDLEGRG